MERDHNIRMPKWFQSEFASHVQAFADKAARELGSNEVYEIFRETYIAKEGPLSLIRYWPRPTQEDPAVIEGELHVTFFDIVYKLEGRGNGPISALVNALKGIAELPPFTVKEYAEDSLGDTADAEAACFIRIQREDSKESAAGVGFDPNVIQAAAVAVIRAVNSLYRED